MEIHKRGTYPHLGGWGREGFPEEVSLSYDLKEILEVTEVQSWGKEEGTARAKAGNWNLVCRKAESRSAWLEFVGQGQSGERLVWKGGRPNHIQPSRLY